MKELKLDEKTLVMLAGDNGSSFPPNSALGKRFDQAANGLRGFKRELYEGGLRNAGIARWPGTVTADRVSDEPWAFWDFLPTCAELSGARLPANVKTDGLSRAPSSKAALHRSADTFTGNCTKVRRYKHCDGDWKAVRNGPSKPIEIYDLKSDSGEQHDVAVQHADVVAKADAPPKSAHRDDPNWPVFANESTYQMRKSRTH